MNDTNDTDDDNDDSEVNQNIRFSRRLWIMIGAWLLVGGSVLVWAGFHYFTNPDRSKFIAETVLSLLVLTAVALQVYIYQRQWGAMQAGLGLNRESMRYSQSAYITVKDVMTIIEETGKPLEFIVRFVNSGTTPAYHCRVYTHVNNKPRPFRFTHEEAKNLEGRLISKSILGANGEIFHQRLSTAPVVLTKDLLQTEKTMPIHFWGIVTYTDVFKRNRWTTFCYIRVPFTPQAEADTEGNEADGY